MSNERLADCFRAQAQWRRRKAEEYQEDRRNEQSAAALLSLADFVEEGADDLEHAVALGRHLATDGSSLGGERAQRAISRYGYGHGVTAGSHAAFLEELLALCLWDAYEYVAENDEDDDPTGSLYDFEIEAALDGVVLDNGYWTRRAQGDMALGDLEDWVSEVSGQDGTGVTVKLELSFSWTSEHEHIEHIDE